MKRRIKIIWSITLILPSGNKFTSFKYMNDFIPEFNEI